MDTIQIERIGGFAGFGGPNLKSRGEVALTELSAGDRAAVEKLFAAGDLPDTEGTADMFRYRVTRTSKKGPQTIEVPGSALPGALTASVRDSLE